MIYQGEPAQRGGVVMVEQCERAVMVEHWGKTQCPNPAVITEPRPVCRKHLDEMRLRARLNVIEATIGKKFHP